MGSRKELCLFTIGIALQLVLTSPCLAASGDAPARISKATAQQLQQRIDALEERNRTLEIQNRNIQDQLNSQRSEIDALKSQIQATAQPVAAMQQQVQQISTMQAEMSDVAKKQRSIPLQVGFRTGWSESPYGMPGGFYYAAYLNHRLLTNEDGIPGGFLSGEMLVGWTQGNHVNTNANLLSQLGHPPFSSWLYTLSLQPTVQYHLDLALIGLAELEAFKPYALAGPAMYISMLSTPVVVKSGNPGAELSPLRC
jgi:hypothetical protein